MDATNDSAAGAHRIAVFLDAQNMGQRAGAEVMTQAKAAGQIRIARAFGHWPPRAKGERKALEKAGYECLEVGNADRGKNGADIALAINADRAARAGEMEIAIVVSSDIDFTPLVRALKERVSCVIGVVWANDQGGAGRAERIYDQVLTLYQARQGLARETLRRIDRAWREHGRGGDGQLGARSAIEHARRACGNTAWEAIEGGRLEAVVNAVNEHAGTTAQWLLSEGAKRVLPVDYEARRNAMSETIETLWSAGAAADGVVSAQHTRGAVQSAGAELAGEGAARGTNRWRSRQSLLDACPGLARRWRAISRGRMQRRRRGVDPASETPPSPKATAQTNTEIPAPEKAQGNDQAKGSTKRRRGRSASARKRTPKVAPENTPASSESTGTGNGTQPNRQSVRRRRRRRRTNTCESPAAPSGEAAAQQNSSSTNGETAASAVEPVSMSGKRATSSGASST